MQEVSFVENCLDATKIGNKYVNQTDITEINESNNYPVDDLICNGWQSGLSAGEICPNSGGWGEQKILCYQADIHLVNVNLALLKVQCHWMHVVHINVYLCFRYLPT